MRLSIEEVKSIILEKERYLKACEWELEDYYKGNEKVLDMETAYYYRNDLIPKIKYDIEYYKNYFID